MFKEKLGLDNVQIERAHRVKNKQNKDKKTKPNEEQSFVRSHLTNRKRKF